MYADCFLLFDHIAALHRTENNFQCPFNDCRRLYLQFKSFQKHFTQKHRVLNSSSHGISVLNKDNCNVTEDNISYLSFSDSDDESIIYEENLTEQVNDMIDESPQNDMIDESPRK